VKEAINIKIQKGKSILCLRFANVGGFDCIDEHIKMLEKNGFVWFGKIGSKPASKALNEMIADNSRYILLKEPKKSYICEFENYKEDMPDKNLFPDYYNTEILPNRKFSIWFKIISILEVNETEKLNSIIVKKSRSPILETARKSMSSHFNTIAKDDVEFC